MTEIQDEEVEKAILKIWNNWMVEADYHLFAAFGIINGKEMAKDFIINLLEKERGISDGLWRIPF